MFFFFKQKTAYEMRISDWSSDVCSSDLRVREQGVLDLSRVDVEGARHDHVVLAVHDEQVALVVEVADFARVEPARSEEHTSELQSLMRISYAVFCLKKKNNSKYHITKIRS